MNTKIELLILTSIERYGSIMPLFESGFSYAELMKETRKLEKEGKISFDEEQKRKLTENGLKRLKGLKHGKREFMLLPLEQHRRIRMDIDEVYLP